MRKQYDGSFEDIVSLENLLLAWEEFVRGKRGKRDVQEFQLHLMDNILSLHRDLTRGTYTHGGYTAFNIADPKPRNIHKASVRDRLVHHALYRTLYPFFDTTFIADSYSCRVHKGTHKALDRFTEFSRTVSVNHTTTAWVLKCDIRKFFANIDHNILLSILASYIPEEKTLSLLRNIIDSFHTKPGKGLPLGNLTSQLLVNIYMNEFDWYVKRTLPHEARLAEGGKETYYIRYADDFVTFSRDKQHLSKLLRYIVIFLSDRLSLTLHPDPPAPRPRRAGKVFIKTLASGVDFLGWVHFPDHRVLRTATKRRMFAKLNSRSSESVRNSYFGLLSHGNAHKLREKIAMINAIP